MSMPIDTDMSMPFEADMSMPFETFMSMPTSCSTYDECPAAGTCDCKGKVADAGATCDCYDIQSVAPPFDESVNPPLGTWYCFQADLDKTKTGCDGKGKDSVPQISHAVFATGFSDKCTFHTGGQLGNYMDSWLYQECDNTAATGLKFDFGHSGSSFSVTYCFDVSCEDEPAGEGTSTWVIKAGNDRCEYQVPGGPSCGGSPSECHPSCPANTGVVDDAPTGVACDGSSGSIGTVGSETVNMSVSFQVETTGSTLDGSLFGQDVLELAASANSLCGSTARALRARRSPDTSPVTGIELGNVASDDTCEPQESDDNSCYIVTIDLQLSGSDPVSVNAAAATTSTAIQNNVDSLVGGDIVRVAMSEYSSSAATNDGTDTPNSSDKSGKKQKRRVILVTVLCAVGTVAAALLMHRKIAQQRRGGRSSDDASSSGGSSSGGSSSGSPAGGASSGPPSVI
jgi:hypothetical protein